MTTDVLTRVLEIYNAKGWDSIDEDLSGRGNPILFGMLVDLCSQVGVEGQKIIYDLLNGFHVVREYRKSCIPIMLAIVDLLQDYQGVVVLPVRDPQDKENSSGNTFVYEVMALLHDPHKQRVRQYDSPYSKDIVCDEDDVVVFLDDFVGTGNQFSKMYSRISNRLSPAEFQLRTLYIMNAGKIVVEKLGVQCFSQNVLQKAIGSGQHVVDLPINEAYKIYDAIESQLRIGIDYRRGFRGAEALLSLKRTPNNTLPIFWHTLRRGGSKWPAPFPR